MGEPRRPWERDKDRYLGLTAAQFNLAVFVTVGGVVAAVCAWLFAFGGAESVGLRKDDKTGNRAAVARTTETPATSAAPVGFEAAPCAFEAPPGQNVDCGYLTVPESREQANGRTVRLPVAVFKTASAERKPDPIVYLAGGPGEDSLEVLPLIFDEALKPLLEDRDLIVFDQRGAGYSEPSLDCPEITQLNYDSLEQQFTADQRVAQDVAAAKRCHDRLVNKGIDPATTTSDESAADVSDLRAALGYEQWNLYGVSYGTKLALTVMRNYPEGIRSVVLDSVYPLQVDVYAELPANFDRALKVLFESCDADASCSETYPGLEGAFYETVRRLDERPVSVALGTITGRPIEGAVIDGDWFATFIFESLYSEQIIPLLPRAIFDTRDGNYELLTLLADSYLQNAEFVSAGMYLSVQCGEELPFTTREALIVAGGAYPQLASYHEYAAKSIFAVCEVWHAKAAAGVENEAVRSAIPTLVLAGHLDPITPPDWGRLVAGDLGRSFFFEYPGLGHGVAFAHDCPRGITLAFFDAPTVEPPSGCIAGMPGPTFLTP